MDVPRGPDMVFLYRRALLDYWAEGNETLGHLVTHVLVHEIGHHFGLSDADMAQHRGLRRRLRCHTSAADGRSAASRRLQSRREPAKVTSKSSGTDDEGFWHLRGSTSSQATTPVGCAGSAHPVGRRVALADASRGPTPEEYVAHVGGDAKLVPAGELKLDGRKLLCGQRPTVIDNNLDDYGAAYPGFLILNQKLLGRVSTPVKLWIHAHECGHQFRGPDEETGRLLRRAARARPELADAGGPGGGVPLHLPGQGRQHAFLGLAPLRGHAPVLRRSDPEISL